MIGFRQASVYHRSSVRPVPLLALACLIFLSLLSGAAPVDAQGNSRALISTPDTKDFPTITALLDIHDAGGQFMHDLQPSEITILEDDHPANLLEAHETQVGVRVIVAINAGPGLAMRDQQGVVRYDTITRALQSWASKSGAAGSKDELSDYSLLTNQGALASTVADPAEWLKAFNSYQPDMRNAQPSLQSLSQAMDLAGEPSPRFGMEKAILYITPPPEEGSLSGLIDLAGQARQTGVNIFIWMVASPGAYNVGCSQRPQPAGSADRGKVFCIFGS